MRAVDIECTHRFDSWRSACDHAVDYLGRLSKMTANGGDQAAPVEVFHLCPPEPSPGALLLIGGMGPLAGAEGFASACRLFKDSREIVLFQACSVPDRSKAIIADQSGASHLYDAVVSVMVEAFQLGAEVVTGKGPVACLVLCNTAHYFLPDVWRRFVGLHAVADRFELVSLIEEVVARIARDRQDGTLVATTTGTIRGRLYSESLTRAGVEFLETSDDLQETLMRGIFEGVKEGDRHAALELGVAFFSQVAARYPHMGALLAGCTEILTIVYAVAEHGPASLRTFLASVTIYDPVALTLKAVARKFGEGSA